MIKWFIINEFIWDNKMIIRNRIKDLFFLLLSLLNKEISNDMIKILWMLEKIFIDLNNDDYYYISLFFDPAVLFHCLKGETSPPSSLSLCRKMIPHNWTTDLHTEICLLYHTYETYCSICHRHFYVSILVVILYRQCPSLTLSASLSSARHGQ